MDREQFRDQPIPALCRPPFEDDSGDFIFPPEGHEDEKWWLTEMSLRKEEEKQARAEDIEEGAPSEATNDSDLVDEKRPPRIERLSEITK